MTSYNLSQIDISKVVVDSDYAKELGINVKSFKTNDSMLYMLNYNKEMLENNNFLKNFRSVITDGTNIICFSPPKALTVDELVKNNEEYTIEEFVEGTMINVFHYKGEWMCTTKGVIGAKCKFFRDFTKTYRTLFLEAMTESKLEFSMLDETCCYSFVLQHPENRIVVPFGEMNLVLISKYKCEYCVVSKLEIEKELLNTTIKRPNTEFMFNGNIGDINNWFNSQDFNYKKMGIVINCNGNRAKLWNNNYLHVKKLRGNNPKIQFQYYHLTKDKLIPEFLYYYPEYKIVFKDFKLDLFKYTEKLWRSYRSCYIYKQKPLKNFGKQYRTHMFRIHKLYISELKPENKYTDKKFIIDYVNKLSPAEIMYSINFAYRENKIDEIKVAAINMIE